jgi:hypothetical protein
VPGEIKRFKYAGFTASVRTDDPDIPVAERKLCVSNISKLMEA